MEYLVIFQSTYQAMALEDRVKKGKINARLIPTPESILASCGLALKFKEECLQSIIQLWERTNEERLEIYKIEKVDNRKTNYLAYQFGKDDL